MLKKSSLTQMDKLAMQGSSFKTSTRQPFLPASEEAIKKRVSANHKTITKMIANIDIEVPRLCNDFIFKKLLSETQSFYQKYSKKSQVEFLKLFGETRSHCIREVTYDALTQILSTLIEGFNGVELSAFKHLLAQVFSWYQGICKDIKDIETKEREPTLFDKNPSANSATFIQAERADETRRSSILSSPHDTVKP